MQVGDKIRAFGDDFEILEIAPRNDFKARGLEPNVPQLLGQGIIGLNLKTNQKEYFYDFDVDM